MRSTLLPLIVLIGVTAPARAELVSLVITAHVTGIATPGQSPAVAPYWGFTLGQQVEFKLAHVWCWVRRTSGKPERKRSISHYITVGSSGGAAGGRTSLIPSAVRT